ncbi:rCG23637, isoform CRA_a [Rattus norvegicus]|uniref:RCG23637, isoform CRA_a n=1 Tax=Rattus norvegicus TaxID=10116 RepID=A6KJS4_RAT|nr:rCG23637, isoform CRA_a [Rattus norvegicus]
MFSTVTKERVLYYLKQVYKNIPPFSVTVIPPTLPTAPHPWRSPYFPEHRKIRRCLSPPWEVLCNLHIFSRVL